MIRQLKIARGAEEIGAWPYDVVVALVRSGWLVQTDLFLIDGMVEWKPLSEAIPPSPSHTKTPIFLGRDDEEQVWMFYCKDDSTVIGPRPSDDIVSLIFVGALTEDNLVFIAGGERWMSVADFLRLIEKEAPGTIEQCRRTQAAIETAVGTGLPARDSDSDNTNWLQTGFNLAQISPHIGGAYLGFNAVKRLKKWLNSTNEDSAPKELPDDPSH